MKKIGIFLVAFLCMVLPTKILAAPYELITYDISIKLNSNRIADIKEEYNVYFVQNVPSFEKIINNKLTTIRPDGTRRVTSSSISNVSVKVDEKDVEFEVSNNSIIVREPNTHDTVSKYTISYTYDYGKDTGVGFDEFYAELINGKIDANISSINFKIEFPSIVDESKIKFLLNSNYIDPKDNVKYTVSGNTVSGSLSRNLKAKESFGFYIDFPDNYFKEASDNYNYWIMLLIIVPILTIVFSIICYIKYKKGNKVKVMLNENVPYGFSSAEIAYLYKGFLKEHDLITILISLANQGYLQFRESDDGYKLDSTNSFTIEKLKDYDLDNASEKLIFEKLFQDKDLVSIKDIEYNLYETLIDTKSSIDNLDNHDKIFFKSIKKDKNILGILLIISIICMNFNSIYLFTSNYFLIPIIVGVMVLGTYTLFIANTKLLIKLVFGVLLIGLSLYVGIAPIMNDVRTLLFYIIGMLLIFVSAYMYRILPNRTKYGNQMLGEIEGFKGYLDKMSISTLKDNIAKNSKYFYEMYPYIYVFETTDMWIHKAESVINYYPDWYITNEEFSLANFQKFIKNMIFTVTQAMFKKQLTGQSSVHVEYHKDKVEDV